MERLNHWVALRTKKGKVINYHLSLNLDAVPSLQFQPNWVTCYQGGKIFRGAKSIFHRRFHWRRDCRIVRSLVRLRNRTVGRRGRQNVCEWQTWEGYYLRVLSWSSLNINVFRSFTNICLTEGKFGRKVFKTKLLSRLSHKVCRLLFSSVLLRKFTIDTFFVSYVLRLKMDGVISTSNFQTS